MRIIPAPKNVKYLSGEFLFNRSTKLQCLFRNIQDNFNTFIYNLAGYSLEKGNDILFYIDDTLNLNDEGYTLEIDKIIKISAKTERGLFYGMQSLKQLFAEHYQKSIDGAKLQCMFITDEPRFGYRSFMFDCSRHFFGVDVLKSYIEAMSLQKLNVFHWHLTDDEGWRVEIDSFPKLTSIGSSRRATRRDNKQISGYFTKKDVAEIVRFAADRYIEVVPEFDFPGHTVAAIAAYPELSCKGEQLEVETHFGIHPEILCAGKDETYSFIYSVLAEIAQMFPSKYVHLGGDEAIKIEWNACEKCQKAIKDLGLKNEEQLQAYMTNKAIECLKQHGKVAICWNESVNSGMLDKSAAIQYWNDGKDAARVIEEVRSGRKTVLSKFTPYYLDYPYAMHSLKAVYEYEPVFKEIADYTSNVLGVEAPIWTEWIDNTDTLAYRVYPRLTAVAETAWSAPQNKDYGDFTRALPAFQSFLAAVTGIKQTQADKCNPKLFKKICSMIKFGVKMIDYDQIKRSGLASREMKKMRQARQGDINK